MTKPRRGGWQNKLFGNHWRKNVRPGILQRDEYRCRLNLPGCKGRADCVHHIVEPERGGSWYDPSNLMASCRPCNLREAAQRTKRFGSRNPSRDWFGGRRPSRDW